MRRGGDGPPDHIVRGLVRLAMAVDNLYGETSRELGLTAQQAQLLCAAQRPAAVGDLAAFLRCDRSNVSHLVERAAGRGLLRRRTAEDDGRVKLIELSDEGQEAVQRFVAALGARSEALLGEWPEDRRDEARAILHDLADALERRPADSAAPSGARPEPKERFP